MVSKVFRYLTAPKSVDLQLIVHNDRSEYVKAGYGGRPIELWPFYKFIRDHIYGDEDAARLEWVEWLTKEFQRTCMIPKKHGGMFRGSVHKLSLADSGDDNSIAWDDPRLLDNKKVYQGALRLVNSRLKMVDSIVSDGYIPSFGHPIVGETKKGKIFLNGGHHRAATLYALGYKSIPSVTIIPSGVLSANSIIRKLRGAVSWMSQESSKI